MRFLLFDRITTVEPGRRLEAVKHVSISDGALADHYPLRAVLPPTLAVEAMAQLGGMLHVLSNDFTVEVLLVLVDRVSLARPVLHGETLTIEATSERSHPYGATMRARALVGDEVVAAAERIAYAHGEIDDPKRIDSARARFAYQSGVPLPAATA